MVIECSLCYTRINRTDSIFIRPDGAIFNDIHKECGERLFELREKGLCTICGLVESDGACATCSDPNIPRVHSAHIDAMNKRTRS